MDLLLILICLLVGGTLGFLGVFGLPFANVGIVVLAACFGAAVGVVLAYVILNLQRRIGAPTRSRRAPVSRRMPVSIQIPGSPAQDPSPAEAERVEFATRLKRFARRTSLAQAIGDGPRQSKMQFWMLPMAHRWSGPKSAKAIRRILIRIQALLRG